MSIVVGTDLSEASSSALAVARALGAQRGDAEVVLVHVVDPDRAGAHDLDDVRSQLDLLADDSSTPRVRAELVVGSVDDTLVGFAETEGSDLIVIAARSQATEDAHLGSTAGQIIARATVPVVVVRDPEPWLAYARGSKPLRVLLGIDDSATCDLGIEWTKGLARRGPVDVVLGAIYYPDDAAAHYGLHAGAVIEADPQIERLVERDLVRRYGGEGASGTRAKTGSEVTTGIVARARRGLGRIGDHVVELANEEHVDVVIVGTGQKTGLGKLGSVSSVIVQDAAQSVVCVPPRAQVAVSSVPVFRQALVATDLSPFADRAVPYAFSLAVRDGEVHVVHVVRDEDADVDEPALLRQLHALAPAGAPQRMIPHLVRGDDAAIAIAQCAARLGVDVICIASHGRSGITRALVGSVADRLLRATRLPVLVLRPA